MGKFELKKLCKATIFPDEVSPYGKEEDMLMELVNFKDEKIEPTIRVNKVKMPFNVLNYMEDHKIKTVRLYLRTKKIFFDEEESEEELDLTYSKRDEETGQLERTSGSSLLIGSSEERSKISE